MRPLLDDKILTSWNALAILGYVNAGWCTHRDALIRRAQKTEAFIVSALWKEDIVYRRIREGKVDHMGTLVDYATLAWAELLLYQTTLEISYLHKAKHLADRVLEHFSSQNGAFYTTDERGEKLIARQIDDHDGVEPCGNSAMAHVLLKLSHYFAEKKYQLALQRLFDAFAEGLEDGIGLPVMLQAYSLAHQGIKEITLAGTGDLTPFLKVCQQISLADFVIGIKTSKKYDFPHFLRDRDLPRDSVIAYVCQNQTCSLPLESPRALRDFLGS